MSRYHKRTVLSLTVLCLLSSMALGQNQFSSFVGPPYSLDNVQGEWINLETQMIKPIHVLGDGSSVVVANEPDNRLLAYDPTLSTIQAEIVLGQGITAIAENPTIDGELWVSVRHQSAVMVIDTSTWRITQVLRPPIGATALGVGAADTPGGIVFAQGKAFVAASSTDSLVVYDAAAKSFLATIPLTRPHNQMTPALARPYAVVKNPLTDPEEIYVLSQISGNQSVPLLSPAGPVDLVLDLNTISGFSLPDFDVVTVDSASNAVTGHTTGVGTLLLGMAFHTQTGQLIVANADSQNGKFIGEASFTGGKVTLNRLTFANLGGSAHNHVSTEPPTTTVPVVMPTDVAIDGFGRVFVAGYASANIGVYDSAGNFLAVLATGTGPRGLAVDSQTGTLYCLNRADNTVWAFDVSLPGTLPPTPIYTTSLTDPTYRRVKEGRIVFLDPSQSGSGTTGCFSCHPDARKDGLTWELSKYFDTTEQHTYQNLPIWKDRKGPMVTQDLRSLEDVPGYHWRAEQLDLEAFNGAFVDLLKGNLLGSDRFQLMKDYVFSTVYPPNPRQQMNRNFTAAASQGVTNYRTLNSDGSPDDPRTCEDCHALPTGTDSSITDALLFTPQSPLAIKTAQLRGMWTKTFSLANADDVNPPAFGIASTTVLPMTGTGFFHSGVIDDVVEFVEAFFPNTLSAPQRRDVEQFMIEFDSGLAPATLYSELLNQSTVGSSQVPYLIDQANNRNTDLVAIGRLRRLGVWINASLLWDTAGQNFKPETTSQGTITWPAIQNLASNGDAELLILGVPHWSGERFALDRDRDGVFNGDELVVACGPLDPKNPDTDGDGQWDGYDPQPCRNPNTVIGIGAPTPSLPFEVFVTANALKLTYTTNQLSPTRVEYGLTSAYGQVEGDPFPLPLNPPARRSNHWKRKHTVFLRLLQDGQPYHFRILTQGQNGQTAATPDMVTTMFLSDEFNPNLRVGALALSGVRNGAQVTYTASVIVLDNANLPFSNAQVTGRLTTYNGNNVGTQTVLQGTTVGGLVLLTFPALTHAPGDRVVFDVPMTAAGPAGPVAGVVDLLTNLPFAWPEGPSMVMQTAP